VTGAGSSPPSVMPLRWVAEQLHAQGVQSSWSVQTNQQHPQVGGFDLYRLGLEHWLTMPAPHFLRGDTYQTSEYVDEYTTVLADAIAAAATDMGKVQGVLGSMERRIRNKEHLRKPADPPIWTP
jgi:hypothetical protein